MIISLILTSFLEIEMRKKQKKLPGMNKKEIIRDGNKPKPNPKQFPGHSSPKEKVS